MRFVYAFSLSASTTAGRAASSRVYGTGQGIGIMRASGHRVEGFLTLSGKRVR
jgi:hypothetical protein